MRGVTLLFVYATFVRLSIQRTIQRTVTHKSTNQNVMAYEKEAAHENHRHHHTQRVNHQWTRDDFDV